MSWVVISWSNQVLEGTELCIWIGRGKSDFVVRFWQQGPEEREWEPVSQHQKAKFNNTQTELALFARLWIFSDLESPREPGLNSISTWPCLTRMWFPYTPNDCVVRTGRPISSPQEALWLNERWVCVYLSSCIYLAVEYRAWAPHMKSCLLIYICPVILSVDVHS